MPTDMLPFGAFGKDDNSMFEDTDIKTILGRNIVLNYLSKIDLELKMFGYSETANEIAEFYEKCKQTKGIIAFYTNPVVKMILEKIDKMQNVKGYLQERMLDDMEIENLERLDYIYNENDKLTGMVNAEKQEYNKQQALYRRKINQISKQTGLSYDKAEQFYKKQQEKQKNMDMAMSLPSGLLELFEKVDKTLVFPSEIKVTQEIQKAFEQAEQAEQEGIVTKDDKKDSTKDEIIIDFDKKDDKSYDDKGEIGEDKGFWQKF